MEDFLYGFVRFKQAFELWINLIDLYYTEEIVNQYPELEPELKTYVNTFWRWLRNLDDTKEDYI